MKRINSPLATAKLVLATCFACVLLFPALSLASTAGVVTYMSGVLSAKNIDGKVRILSAKSEIYAGDILSTEKRSFARIKFTDGGEVVLRPESQLKIDSYSFKEDDPAGDSNSFNLVKGGLRALTGTVGKRSRSNYEMKTQAASLGIRGTHYGLVFCQDNCSELALPSGKIPDNGLHVDVTEGAVELTNAAGSQVVNAGEFAYVSAINIPPVLVPADQAVKPPQPSSEGGGLFGKGGSSDGCALR